MWVHLDFLKDVQRTSISSKKKYKRKACTSNTVAAVPEDDTTVHTLSDSDEELKESLAVNEDQQQPSRMCSERDYLKSYDQVVEAQLPEKNKPDGLPLGKFRYDYKLPLYNICEESYSTWCV